MRKLLASLALLLTVALTGCDAPGMGNNGVGATTTDATTTTTEAPAPTTTTIPVPTVRELSQAEKEELYLASVFNVQWPASQSEDVLLRFGYAACDKLNVEGVYPGTWIYEKGGALEMLNLKRDKVMDLAYVIATAHSTLCPPRLASAPPVIALPPLPTESASAAQ